MLNDLPPARPAATYTLLPGDIVCAERGDSIETLLGSCVSIILTDPRRTVAAMCHIVCSRSAPIRAAPSGAYADVALERMYEMLRSRGMNPGACEAYLVGGGNMFPSLITGKSVGDDNARWALDALNRDGLPVLQVDVGGTSYRRLKWVVGVAVPTVVSVPV